MFNKHLLMGPLMMAYDTTTGPLPPSYAAGPGFDPYLTDIAVADMEADQEFITPNIFPRVPVQQQMSKFKVWDRGSLLRPEFRAHAYGDIPVKGGWKTNEAGYSCEVRSLKVDIDPQDKASARNPMQPEEDGTYYLTQQARIDIDLQWAKKYFNSGATWTFQYQGVAANPNAAAGTPEFLQFDQIGVNPARMIRGRLERMRLAAGRKPNVLVLGADVYASLTFNADIVDRVKYTQEGIADLTLLARFFDVDKVLVAGGVYNKAAEGLDDQFAYMVSPKDMLLLYAAPRPSRNTPSAGYTFVWERLYEHFEGGEQERILNELVLIRRGINTEAGSRWLHAYHACGLEIVAPDLGMYFKDVVATSAADW